MPRAATRRAVVAAALAVLLPAPALAVERLYVVVSARSPVRTLGRAELLALYTGRTRSYPGGEIAVPLDQSRDGAVRAAFYEALAGMEVARINSYWARLHFTSQLQPPRAVGDDAAVIKGLLAEPLAIGYLTHGADDPSLRLLLTLP